MLKVGDELAVLLAIEDATLLTDEALALDDEILFTDDAVALETAVELELELELETVVELEVAVALDVAVMLDERTVTLLTTAAVEAGTETKLVEEVDTAGIELAALLTMIPDSADDAMPVLFTDELAANDDELISTTILLDAAKELGSSAAGLLADACNSASILELFPSGGMSSLPQAVNKKQLTAKGIKEKFVKIDIGPHKYIRFS